jgi:hypothetical protein
VTWIHESDAVLNKFKKEMNLEWVDRIDIWKERPERMLCAYTQKWWATLYQSTQEEFLHTKQKV